MESEGKVSWENNEQTFGDRGDFAFRCSKSPEIKSKKHEVFPEKIKTVSVDKIEPEAQEKYTFQSTWQYWDCGKYAICVATVAYQKYDWLLKEWMLTSEGQAVSKMVVALYILYCASFLNLASEFMWILLFTYAKKNCRFHDAVALILRRNDIFLFIGKCVNIVSIVILGNQGWDYIMNNCICKTYHDKSCVGSWIGGWTRKYRDSACYDGKASSVVCEKFISYLPLIFVVLFVVIIGNWIMPMIADHAEKKMTEAIMSRSQKSRQYSSEEEDDESKSEKDIREPSTSGAGGDVTPDLYKNEELLPSRAPSELCS